MGNQKQRAKKPDGIRLLGLILVVVGIVLIGYYLYIHYAGRLHSRLNLDPSPALTVPAEPGEPPQEDAILYPTDRLFVTDERAAYGDGEMTLRIPRLGLDAPVLAGTGPEVLQRGVGLYEYAQLPGEGNRNVSIAGHRDIYGAEFYYLDQLQEGDACYLNYGGREYTYIYHDTAIVEPDDWGPVYCREYGCLTLTSCDPVGTSERRIVVTARRVDSAQNEKEADAAQS